MRRVAVDLFGEPERLRQRIRGRRGRLGRADRQRQPEDLAQRGPERVDGGLVQLAGAAEAADDPAEHPRRHDVEHDAGDLPGQRVRFGLRARRLLEALPGRRVGLPQDRRVGHPGEALGRHLHAEAVEHVRGLGPVEAGLEREQPRLDAVHRLRRSRALDRLRRRGGVQLGRLLERRGALERRRRRGRRPARAAVVLLPCPVRRVARAVHVRSLRKKRGDPSDSGGACCARSRKKAKKFRPADRTINRLAGLRDGIGGRRVHP